MKINKLQTVMELNDWMEKNLKRIRKSRSFREANNLMIASAGFMECAEILQKSMGDEEFRELILNWETKTQKAWKEYLTRYKG